MNISVNIKSGTGGWVDYDGCDFCVIKITHENFPIPRVGEITETTSMAGFISMVMYMSVSSGT